MRRVLILTVFSLLAACAGTPDHEQSSSIKTEPECPSGQILFVEDDRYYCLDERALEPEDCWPCARERDWFNDDGA